MYAVDRTHRKREDLAWAPPALRRRSWVSAGVVWGGAAAAGAGAALLAPWAVAVYAKALPLLVLGGLAGARVRERALHGHVLRLARGEIELGRLQGESDGELVLVRGRVRAETTLRSVLHDREAVFRRLRFALRGEHLIHEAAVDFALVDDAGERIAIEAYGARLVIPPIDPLDYPARLFAGERLSPSLKSALEGHGLDRLTTLSASEQLVRAGDRVQILGYKARAIDPTAPALARDTPMRASLRSGRTLPLLIYKEEPVADRS